MAFDMVRFSTIAHRDLAICNPITSQKLDGVLAVMDLPPRARVLDVGCGKAEMLMRLIERFQCASVGVDTNGEFLAEARARAFDRGVSGDLELVETRFQDYEAPGESFDAALCVGATHAVSDLAKTFTALKKLVKPGGRILVGEGYWRKKPDKGYLKLLGAGADDMSDHAGNVAAGIKAGLTYLFSTAANEDDFDSYEGMYNRAMESWCAENPDDPDMEAMRNRIRSWREGYHHWGRETLGFGMYLFRK